MIAAGSTLTKGVVASAPCPDQECSETEHTGPIADLYHPPGSAEDYLVLRFVDQRGEVFAAASTDPSLEVVA